MRAGLAVHDFRLKPNTGWLHRRLWQFYGYLKSSAGVGLEETEIRETLARIVFRGEALLWSELNAVETLVLSMSCLILLKRTCQGNRLRLRRF